MTVFSKVMILGDPVLRASAQPVKDVCASENHKIAGALAETLYHFRRQHGFGRGIAAPQINYSKRILYLEIPKPIVMINPEVLWRSRSRFQLWDDCLSLPYLYAWVERYQRLSVRYWDLKGKRRTVTVDDRYAELLQHELDHLDGILMIDRVVGQNPIFYREALEREFENGNLSVRPDALKA